MKKAANVLCIISAILTCLAVVLLIFTPQMLGDASYLVGTGTSGFDILSETILASWPAGHKALINFGNYQSNVLVLIFAIALLLIVVLWIVHIVVMAVKKRGNATWVNVAFILFGLVSLDFLYIFLVPGYLGGTGSIMDSVLAISDVMKKILGLLPYVLAAISLILVVIALFVSFADMAKNPGAKKRFSQVPDGFVNVGAVNPSESVISADKKDTKDEKASSPSAASKNDDEIRSILNSELGDETAANANLEPIVEGSGCGKGASAINPGSYSGPAPTIVQYISYGPDGMKGPRKDEKPLTRDDIRDIVADEMKKQNAAPVEEETPAGNDVLTSDDLRSIIREEIAGHKDNDAAAPTPETEGEADTTKDSTNATGEVMTSEDLRQIVAEEIAKAEKGETAGGTPAANGDSDVLTSDDLRSIIREELGIATKDIEQKEKDEIASEVVPAEKEVEEESSDVLTSDDLRSIVAEEIKKANGEKAPEATASSATPKETTDEASKDEAITTDDLRSIIREELSSKKDEDKEDAESEEKPEEKPLTANDLRTLIQEALEEHDNPERRQLTEDEARDLIVEQIRSFYLGKEKDQEEEAAKEETKEETKPEEKAAPKAEVAPVATPVATSNEILSSDDLRAIIHDEIASIKPVAQPAPVATEGVSSDDIKKLLSDELTKFRAEQALASQKAADEAADAHKIEQARAEAEAEQTKAQSEEIKNIKSSALSPDDIRSIVAEELDKKLAEKSVVTEKVVETPKEEVKKEPAPEVKPVEKKEEAKPTPKAVIAPLAPKEEPKKEEVKPAPKAEVKPTPAPKKEVTPVVVPAPVIKGEEDEEGETKAKIIRIPFADRMLKADKELQSNYNELKAECLSYGLKSRLSNSGDTFRLHTKTYVKITIAGKGLKLYFALNPKDYASGPIPLHDASGKNIYKEIPGVFKVKSPLSLKRAKQLLADAVEKDNLEQGKIEPHNWAIELKDYKPQLGGKDDED